MINIILGRKDKKANYLIAAFSFLRHLYYAARDAVVFVSKL